MIHALDLLHNMCRKPMWSNKERPTHFYCGKLPERGSYCLECSAKLFVKHYKPEGYKTKYSSLLG